MFRPYLYTKIVYFVRTTCFDLINSFSGPPRRQIQELLRICLLGGPEDNLIKVETCHPDKIYYFCI